MKKQIIKISICIFIPLNISFVLLFFSSLLVLNTNIPENLDGVFMTAIAAIHVIIMTVLFTKAYNFKPIICSLISFIFIILIKTILTLIITNSITLSPKSLINMLFTFVFSIIGAMIGVNTKK